MARLKASLDALECKEQLPLGLEVAVLQALISDNYLALADNVQGIGGCIKVLQLLDTAKWRDCLDFTFSCLGELYTFKDKFSLGRDQFRFCTAMRG